MPNSDKRADEAADSDIRQVIGQSDKVNLAVRRRQLVGPVEQRHFHRRAGSLFLSVSIKIRANDFAAIMMVLHRSRIGFAVADNGPIGFNDGDAPRHDIGQSSGLGLNRSAIPAHQII